MTVDQTDGESRARNQALSLLERAHGIRAEVEQARNIASSSGRAQMSKIIASLSGAEVRLALAADAPSNQPIDLSGIEAALGSTEQEVETAVHETSLAGGGIPAGQLAAVTAATRQEVQSVSGDLFERRVLDPYLQFDSPDDAAAYKEREAARQKAIAHNLAAHSAEGDYQAGLLEERQLDDAGAHGATRSPQYESMRIKLHNVLQQHKEALDAKAAEHPEPGSSGKANPSQATAAQTPIVTVKPDMGVDLASIGVTADPTVQTTGHGLPDQPRTPAGQSTGRG